MLRGGEGGRIVVTRSWLPFNFSGSGVIPCRINSSTPSVSTALGLLKGSTSSNDCASTPKLNKRLPESHFGHKFGKTRSPFNA